jgi:hypothetical protein
VSRRIKVSTDLSRKRKRPKNGEEMVRKFANWLTHEQAEELKEAVAIYEEIREEEPSVFAARMEKQSKT